MTRYLLALLIAATGAITLVAQAPTPQFEVASIHASGDTPPAGAAGVRFTDQQARFVFLSLRDYIGIAYGVKIYQIVGPEWLGNTRFDITAKIPEGQAMAQLVPMLRSLLEDRFKMRTHRESREFPVYGLQVVQGPSKLVRLPEETPQDGALTITSTSGPGGVVVDLGQGASLTMGNNRFEAKKVTMAILADTLARFVDKPVVDMTKLEGRYNIAFELSPEDFQAMMIRSAVAAGISLPAQALRLLDTASPAAVPDALRGLGLQLESTKAPLDVIVIDSSEKAPIEN